MNITLTSGESCEVKNQWGGRAIIDYSGVYVMVDQIDEVTWELSGEPARPGVELDTLNGLVKILEEKGTVTTKDGSL